MFVGTLPAASNRADWSEVFELFDDESGDPIDLSNAVIVLQVRDDCRRIDASIAIVDIGKFQATITADNMHQFCAGTYQVGCTLTQSGIVSQEFVGSLPILDGVVR